MFFFFLFLKFSCNIKFWANFFSQQKFHFFLSWSCLQTKQQQIILVCGACEMIKGKNNTAEILQHFLFFLSRHFVDDVIDSRLGKAWHKLVDDFFDKNICHAGTAAFGKLEWSSQVDNIRGVSIVAVVVILVSIAARYLRREGRALSKLRNSEVILISQGVKTK